MIDQEQNPGPELEAARQVVRRRRAGIAAFVGGFVAALAVFAFWPGLPHVIDWGAILVALVVGALARWICQSWMTRGADHG